MPMRRASSPASSTSAAGTEGETPVTASARSPSTSAATAATKRAVDAGREGDDGRAHLGKEAAEFVQLRIHP